MLTHSVHVELSAGHVLQEKLERGVLDAALVYRPEYWPGMQVEQLMEEKLVLVSSRSNPEPYIYVDWGPVFRKEHDAALPEHAKSALSFNLGPLALQYILQYGGAGYFRTRGVQPWLEMGMLEKMPHAPEFSYPVYLVYSRKNESTALHQAFEVLRELVSEEPAWSQPWSFTCGAVELAAPGPAPDADRDQAAADSAVG